MTREEFFYQCVDVIEHWLNGNRKISDLREVTDKLYNEVTKPHWISVEDELPKEDGIYLWYKAETQGVHVAPYWVDLGFANKSITHWMYIPAPPTKKGGKV